jgi:hypothetical protein
MNAALSNFVSRTKNQARILKDAMALSQELVTLYNGTPDYGAQITQAEIDSVPSFAEAGLTKGQLDGVVYSLGVINAQITSYLTEFVMLANLP